MRGQRICKCRGTGCASYLLGSVIVCGERVEWAPQVVLKAWGLRYVCVCGNQRRVRVFVLAKAVQTER